MPNDSIEQQTSEQKLCNLTTYYHVDMNIYAVAVALRTFSV